MVLNILCILLSSIIFNTSVLYEHDFHLSKCDIHYNIEESSLQISLNVFLDDLELALSSEGYDSLAICTKKESETAEKIMYDYIQRHLVITVDNEAVNMNWVGKEISEDLAAVWSYLEIPDVKPQKSILVQNNILMDAFQDQQNVVKLVMDKKRKSFFLFNYKEFSGRMDL